MLNEAMRVHGLTWQPACSKHVAQARQAEAELREARGDASVCGSPLATLHPNCIPVAPPLAAAGAQLRFRDLVGGKNVKADRRRQRLQAAGRLALDTALFTLLWWAWTQLQPAMQ